MFQDCVKNKRYLTGGFVGAVASLVIAIGTPAEAAKKHTRARGGYNPPYADMVVDVKTGKILRAVNADALRHPASITKVMTLYLLFEQLERGTFNLNSPLRVSANAASQAPSKLGVRPGQTINVEDAIKALVTKSANDVAVVIAENIGGSETAFANMMTRKAHALGMSRTVYRNASGLPDMAQVTTARDLTILAQAVQDRFPKYYLYFQTSSFEYGGRVIGNHNRLIGRVEGVDGIKTGYTRASGFNLMTNAKTDDRHIVAVVLGGRSTAIRDNIMADLVRSNLPRAYAGGRTAPVVAENTAADRRTVTVASADTNIAQDEVETTASTVPVKVPVLKAKDARTTPAKVRPVVASAANAATTKTPSSDLRWKSGVQALPQNAQAYAPTKQETQPSELTKILVKQAKASPESNKAAAAAETKKPVSGWIIQLGASDSESKAKTILDQARSRSGKTLAKASPFTEKINSSGTTLYRARFSGFAQQDEAQNACKALKRSGFSCFASRG